MYDFLAEGMEGDVEDGRLGQVFVSRGRGFRFPVARFPVVFPVPVPARAGTSVRVTSGGALVYERCFATAPSDADIDAVAAQIKQL